MWFFPNPVTIKSTPSAGPLLLLYRQAGKILLENVTDLASLIRAMSLCFVTSLWFSWTILSSIATVIPEFIVGDKSSVPKRTSVAISILQWAAVKTQRSDINVPPHLKLLSEYFMRH